MRPLILPGLLLSSLFLSAQLRAGQVQGPVSGDFQTGTQAGTVGANLAAPTPIQLSVPSLMAASTPGVTPVLAPAPGLILPVVAHAAVAQPAIVPVANVLPALPASAVTAVKPRALAENTHAAPFAAESAEFEVDAGRTRFDQSTPRSEEPPAIGGLWGKVKDLLSVGEAAPAWPGKAGDAVRIGKIKTALGKPIGDGGTSKVWQSQYGQFAIKILHPGAMEVSGVREEAATLRAIADTDLPVAKLLAESRDGKVLVKEFIEGDTAHKILERGAFSRPQVEGWPELAAKLIQSGLSADLARATRRGRRQDLRPRGRASPERASDRARPSQGRRSGCRRRR